GIGEQVAGALVAAHRASIVHRDVKPGNVLIDETGTAKLTDFGISRAAGDMTLTQTGLIGGTPAYLAPELARGADPTPSSDVFALGATLYHAIERKPVYGDSDNQLALLYSAARRNAVRQNQAGGATALLMSLLRADPDGRLTMAQARSQLSILAENGSAAPTASSPGSQAGSRAEGKPPWQRAPAANAPAAAAPADSQAASQDGPSSAQPGTASFRSVPPYGQQSSPAASGTTRQRRKRTPIILGAAGALVIIAAVVLAIVFSSGGSGEPAAGGKNSESTPPQQTSSARSEPSSVNSAPVNWSSAGEFVGTFYTDPGSTETWRMLGPRVQQQYGSQQEFASEWSDYELEGMGKIR